MSPLELAREFKAAHLRRRDTYDRDVTQAWMGVAIWGMAHKKMPTLNSLLSDAKDGHAQSHEEMKSALMNISQLTGFKVRHLKKES